MRPVSERFLRTVRGSHRVVVEARVVAPGQTGVDPAGTVIPITDGDVQMDATQQNRSTLDVTTPGKGMWPARTSDLLAPYGNELFVRRGVLYGDGVTEWVSLGYFRLDTPEQDDAPDGPIRLLGTDRMAGIIDGQLTSPKVFQSTISYGNMVAELVQDIYPWATIEWDDTTARDTAIGRQVIAETDRWQAINDLVTAAGKVWSWDYRGVLVVRTPAPASGAVWEINHGGGGVLVSLSRRLTREGVYNGVVATGEGGDALAPVRGVAFDNNPNSPTYWYGPFGKVPRFFSSPLILQKQQALQVAASLLTRRIGLPYAVDFTAVPNPALEPGDPIRVTYPGRSETHVIDRMTIPLTASGALTASTREQTSVLIGGA